MSHEACKLYENLFDKVLIHTSLNYKIYAYQSPYQFCGYMFLIKQQTCYDNTIIKTSLLDINPTVQLHYMQYTSKTHTQCTDTPLHSPLSSLNMV